MEMWMFFILVVIVVCTAFLIGDKYGREQIKLNNSRKEILKLNDITYKEISYSKDSKEYLLDEYFIGVNKENINYGIYKLYNKEDEYKLKNIIVIPWEDIFECRIKKEEPSEIELIFRNNYIEDSIFFKTQRQSIEIYNEIKKYMI